MNNAQATRDRLAADFQTVMKDIEELIGAEGENAGDKVSAIRSRIGRRLDRTRQAIGRLQEGSIERAREAARRTDGYIHDHPWQAVGLGAVIGLSFGMLIARAERHH